MSSSSSSTADDLTDVVHQLTTVLDIEDRKNENETENVKKEEEDEEFDDLDNKIVRDGQEIHDNSDAWLNPVKLPETELLGLGNAEEANGGSTDATKSEKSKSDVPISPNLPILPISPDRSEIIEEDQQHEVFYGFPPGLSTLNVNGRPRFEVVTVRDNGRLQMFMVPNLSPQLVRSPGRNGRLKMWLLNDDRHGGDRALPPVRRSI